MNNNKWILCSDRLPDGNGIIKRSIDTADNSEYEWEESDIVLIYGKYHDGTRDYGFATFNRSRKGYESDWWIGNLTDGLDFCDQEPFSNFEVIAWMPLSKPSEANGK